jgi:hypothetical protein
MKQWEDYETPASYPRERSRRQTVRSGREPVEDNRARAVGSGGDGVFQEGVAPGPRVDERPLDKGQNLMALVVVAVADDSRRRARERRT